MTLHTHFDVSLSVCQKPFLLLATELSSSHRWVDACLGVGPNTLTNDANSPLVWVQAKTKSAQTRQNPALVQPPGAYGRCADHTGCPTTDRESTRFITTRRPENMAWVGTNPRRGAGSTAQGNNTNRGDRKHTSPSTATANGKPPVRSSSCNPRGTISGF